MLFFRHTAQRHLSDFAIQAGLPENPDGFVFLFQIVNELKEDLAVPKSRD